MAFGSGIVNSFGTAAGDLLGGFATESADRLKAQGDLAEAENYGMAAVLAGQNEKYTETSTAVQEAALQRNFEQVQGKTIAGIAGSGFTNSGSAQDIIRSNTQQGAVAQQVASQQGLITEAGYEEQQKAYENMQAASIQAADEENEMAGQARENGFITGGISAAAGIASIFT